MNLLRRFRNAPKSSAEIAESVDKKIGKQLEKLKKEIRKSEVKLFDGTLDDETVERLESEIKEKKLAAQNLAGVGRHIAMEAAMQVEWMKSHGREFEDKFAGEYIAIVDGKVVDHGDDMAALAGRTVTKYGKAWIVAPELRKPPKKNEN